MAMQKRTWYMKVRNFPCCINNKVKSTVLKATFFYFFFEKLQLNRRAVDVIVHFKQFLEALKNYQKVLSR